MKKTKEESELVIPLSEKQQKLIQRLGNIGSKEGLPPSCAQIASLMMISDKVELTFDEIRHTLNLSKSATSNAINFLLVGNQLEAITKLGDRKRYFRSNIHTWKDVYFTQIQKIEKINELLHEIRDVRTPETVEFNNALDELNSFMDYVVKSIPKIFEEWEKLHLKNED